MKLSNDIPLLLTPIYRVSLDVTPVELLPTARLYRFKEPFLDNFLTPDSDLRKYLALFPPQYLLAVGEPLSGDFNEISQAGEEQLAKVIVDLFQDSLTRAENLILSLRLWRGGLLQRGSHWIVGNSNHGQLSVRVHQITPSAVDWVGGEGHPYTVSPEEVYRFDKSEGAFFSAFSREVARTLRSQESQLLRRIIIALQYYQRAYGVEWKSARVLDLITCLESLLFDRGEELSHRLAMRCANLLGEDGTQRRKIYSDVKDFYGVRSRLVHGDKLNERQTNLIAEVGRLHEYVRRALLSVMSLVSSGESDPEVYSQFDEMGLDETIRKSIHSKCSRLLHLKA